MEQSTVTALQPETETKLDINRKMPSPRLAVFLLAFVLVGGYLVLKSFAAGPLVAGIQAEQMILPAGGSVYDDAQAFGGKAVLLDTTGTATGTVNLPSAASSLTVQAKGRTCKGWPQLVVSVDYATVLTTTVSSTSWSSYSVTKSLAAGSHFLSLKFSNDSNRGNCNRGLYLDVTNFYGSEPAPTSLPTVAITANPTSVTAGQASTLTWTSTNASSCSASGGWSGAQPTSGSTSTGAINVSTTYTLSCTGSGGSAQQSVTVTIAGVVTSLGSKVAGVYWPNWSGTPALRDVPSIDNLIYAAFAYGDGSQGGGVIWKSDDGSGVSAATFKADMQYVQSRGQKVILSVGGSNDLGIHMTTSTQVIEMVNSINQIVTEYGFDGIDWDLENTANFNAASIVSASNQLKQKWGQNFIIAMAPAPSATVYKDAAKQLGANLDFFAMQFYGYSATDTERISGIKSRINEMVNAYGIPAKKLGIGASNYNTQNSTYVSSPTVYQQAFDQLEVTYPDLRGVFVWDAILEKTHNWPFTNLVGTDVRNL